MICSMTGFGRAELKKNDVEIVAEIHSVNNRFLDIQVRLPKQFIHLEHEVKALVKGFALRGHINVFVNLKLLSEEELNGMKINEETVSSYLKLLKRLKKKYRLAGRLKIDHVLAFSDIFSSDENSEFKAEIWEATKKILQKALENFLTMRQEEGKSLCADLKKRIEMLQEKVNRIRTISDNRHHDELIKLKQRLAEIIEQGQVDETRLETEIALMMNRIDVTEECVRFNSHNQLFLNSLAGNEASGRKLNFLLQEMTREANTIGSKANQAEISHLVVDVKEEIEKIREQVQNIE